MGITNARFVVKPWGQEEIFAHTERYVGKILSINAGESLSLQYHRSKDETLRVLDGTGELHMGRQPGAPGPRRRCDGCPGRCHHISPGVIHRLVALTDIRILEVSTPELDDVVQARRPVRPDAARSAPLATTGRWLMICNNPCRACCRPRGDPTPQPTPVPMPRPNLRRRWERPVPRRRAGSRFAEVAAEHQAAAPAGPSPR